MNLSALLNPVFRLSIMASIFASPALFSADLSWAISPKGALDQVSAGGNTFLQGCVFRVAAPEWKKTVDLTGATFDHSEISASKAAFIGTLSLGKGEFDFREEYRKDGAKIEIDLCVNTTETIKAEGLFLYFRLPIKEFLNGTSDFSVGGKSVKNTTLPISYSENTFVIANLKTDSITFRDKLSSMSLEVRFSKAVYIQLQDDRKWNQPGYGLLVTIHQGDIPKGKDIEFSARMTVDSAAFRSAAVSPEPSSAVWRGLGGNFCFQVKSPQTEYNLRHLDVSWARVRAPLDLWEPENDNADPAVAASDRFLAQDRPNSELRAEFEFARRLAEKKIPLIFSAWDLPQWLYGTPANPRRDPDAPGRFGVPRENWPEMYECIGTYLLHARDRYGAEPFFFHSTSLISA
jgi:hypothetical protein